MLKWAVVQFIQENDILLEYNGGSVYEASIFYNPNYGCWQLSLDSVLGPSNLFSDTASSVESMIEECKKYISAEWEQDVAPTGIKIWKAKNFKLLLK